MIVVLILGIAILGVVGVFAQLSIRDNTTAIWQALPQWASFAIIGLGLVLLVWGLMWGWNLSPSDTL